jgi:hypothetical protein
MWLRGCLFLTFHSFLQLLCILFRLLAPFDRTLNVLYPRYDPRPVRMSDFHTELSSPLQRSHSRDMQLTFVTFAAVLLSILSLLTSTLASGCTLPPCGRAVNKTRWEGRWADFGGGNNLCHVYNWNGGTGWNPPNGKRVRCTQHSLPAHSDVGGFFNDGIDVDGLTFHDRRWRIIWPGGSSYDFAPGVWAKFSSAQTVTCTENGAVPECRVGCVVDPLFIDSCVGQ